MTDNKELTQQEKLIDFILNLTNEECDIIINALKKEQP